MRFAHWTLGLAGAIATAALTASSLAVAPARAARDCGPRGYAYAGLQVPRSAHGIGAGVTALADPRVERGHVAAWVGVGGTNQGPHGTREWLQIGMNRVAGDDSKLYYEIARPSGAIQYHRLRIPVRVGRRYRVAVLEMVGRPSVWRVWVNGRAVSRPIYLPRSHGRLTPMAMSESWDGGVRSCNSFAYRFRRVSLAGGLGGAWNRLASAYVLQDPGYRVVRDSSASFLAATRGMLVGRVLTSRG